MAGLKTKLEQIETATELVQLVSWQGVSTKQEDICKMQDIIGHSTLDELIKLANDNGRCDANGNPDPDGTWCCGRRGTRQDFYHLLSVIWNWEDLIRFWNEHTDPGYKELRELREHSKDMEEQINRAAQEKATSRDMYNHQAERAHNAEKKVEELEAEILKLKAKLYDMMTNNGAA